MSFFASLGLKWNEFKSGMEGARAEVDKFSQKVNNKGMFADFQSRAGKLGDAARGIGQSLAGGNVMGAIAGTEAALMSMGPALGAVAAGAAVVGVAAMGMWAAMSKTKELTNLATQSGITLVELMALEKAFAKAGASSEAVPATMQKLASALGELHDPASKASQAFASIGLNADSFQGKTQYEAYKLVSNGIEGLTSTTDKLIAKRALLGRGAPMIAGSAIEKAEKMVSPSAQLMQDFAPTFAIFQAQIGKLAVSFTPLFAGMASEVVPTLMSVIDKLERLDLTKIGQDLGKSIADALNMALDIVTKIKIGLSYLDPGAIQDAFESKDGGVIDSPAVMKAKIAARATSGGAAGATEAAKAEALAKNPARPTDTGIDISTQLKPEKLAMPIVDSLTKVGGGSGAGSSMLVDINREQLVVQQKIANVLQSAYGRLKPETSVIDINGNAATAN
ncbi:MAG: hypothetical protein ORN83_08895 [Chthoniobacteraceae bacterium]|nr:hypothetical protein [Chthoniobacteraceae bacterium]